MAGTTSIFTLPTYDATDPISGATQMTAISTSAETALARVACPALQLRTINAYTNSALSTNVNPLYQNWTASRTTFFNNLCTNNSYSEMGRLRVNYGEEWLLIFNGTAQLGTTTTAVGFAESSSESGSFTVVCETLGDFAKTGSDYFDFNVTTLYVPDSTMYVCPIFRSSATVQIASGARFIAIRLDTF